MINNDNWEKEFNSIYDNLRFKKELIPNYQNNYLQEYENEYNRLKPYFEEINEFQEYETTNEIYFDKILLYEKNLTKKEIINHIIENIKYFKKEK